MIETIESVHNPRVKLWAQLLDRKGRDKQGAYLVEGIHMVKEALHSGASIDTLLVSKERGMPEELQALAGGQKQVWVSEAVLAKCSDTLAPQPVIAIVFKKTFRIEELYEKPDSLVVVIDRVQDPGNVGTIIRSADAVGASGVILGKGTADLYNPKTVRSTMGALFHVPVAEGIELPALLAAAKAKGIRVFNTSLQAKKTCYDADLTSSAWFVFGNEGSGVSGAVAEQVDEHLIIPMAGRAESLNVAMAATVLLFEAARQRSYAAK